jgi:hypothetical protein
MRQVKVITSVLAGAGMLAGLTFAIVTFATSNASATPAIAKGQPCTTCHTGTPPSKANLNDTGKKAIPKK